MTTMLALDLLNLGIYGIIAGVATFVAIILALLMIFGIGGDADADFSGGDADGDGGVLSLRSITGFAMGFGWGGVIGESLGWSWLGCFALAMGLAFAMFVIIVIIMKVIYSMRSDGTLNYESLIGMTAKVYITIPPSMKTGGQVMVSHPSQLFYLPAVQHEKEALPAGTNVIIQEVNSGVLTVERN